VAAHVRVSVLALPAKESMTPPQPSRPVRLFRELKRRRVFTSTAAYVVLAALLIELSGFIFEAFLLPSWASRLVTILFVLGFPVVVVLAWVFDVSHTGITRTEPVSRAPAGETAPGGLATAFRRSHASPVPEARFARRGRPAAAAEGEAGGASDDGEADVGEAESLDPVRLRQATLGHVRHELRTPINGIIGYAEMLLEDVEEPELIGDLQRIRSAGGQLLERVDSLLQPDRVAPDVLDDLAAFGRQVGVDLRTPVSAVVGYAEMLMEECADAGRDHLLPDLERIVAATRRLLLASEDIVGLAAMVRGGPDAAMHASTAMTGEVLARIRPVAPGEGVAEGAGRLLVVDDNETNRDLVSRQLARYGYTVATAGDGREALELLERKDFDLVLLDVIMPVMHGVETLRRMRASERLRDIPVIMLSSLDETDSAVRCIEMGASDYLAKPVQPTLLEARIAAALAIREMHRREEAYRRRIVADDDLLGRLLRGALPDSLVDRVRAGALDVQESWPSAAVLRGRIRGGLRPGTGSDAPDRIRQLRELLGRFEEVARTHGASVVLWRVDGFLVVVQADGGTPRDAVAAAARLALDTAAAWDGNAAGFALDVGEVAGAVLGEDRPRFEVWGDAVDAVEALAAAASAGTILAAPSACNLLAGAFTLEPRGVMEVPGLGATRVHALSGERPSTPGAIGTAPATT
jgi:adenylate cyclase